MATDARAALEDLWRRAGGEPGALERVTLAGADPILPTDFKIGTAASATIAAGALAATEIWRLRTGREQAVSVDLRAAVAAFRSERYQRLETDPSLDRRDPVFGFYRAGDGRFIQIHSNLPHHREGALKLLGCEATREAVADAVAKWTAGDLEDAFAAAGLPTGMVRSRAEWHAHPQGRAVAALPLFEILKIGEAPPEPAGDGPRALSGLRVLDLTRVIAGPVCGRTLAAYGADVLLVTAPHLPNVPGLVVDTGLGKLSASLDLRRGADLETLRVALEPYASSKVQFHALRTRQSGARQFVSVHVLVPGAWTVQRGHHLLEQIEASIRHALPHVPALGGPVSGRKRPSNGRMGGAAGGPVPAGQGVRRAVPVARAGSGRGRLGLCARPRARPCSSPSRACLRSSGRWPDSASLLSRVTGGGTF